MGLGREERDLLVALAIVVFVIALYAYRRRQSKRDDDVAERATAGTQTRASAKAAAAQDPPEQAVIVHLHLTAPGFGTDSDLDRMHELEDALTEAVEAAGVGVLDGHEIGVGTCELYLYGKNADELLRVVAPIVHESGLAEGAWALKRFGPADDPDAPTARVELDEVGRRPS